MKVALVSTGLGRVLRGFESFTESLFQAMKRYAPGVEVTLFQGGGKPAKDRRVIPNFHREDIPARCFNPRIANLIEQRSFAMSIYPFIRKGNFGIVHYNELVFGSALFHLRRLFGGRFKLLYVNGAPSPPVHYHHRCDFAQLLTEPAHRDAIKFGMKQERLFLVPYGVDAERFSTESKNYRASVRKDLGIPEDARVVLTICALKREHKRVDFIIREISRLDPSYWLLAAGQRTSESNSLEEEANQSIPHRWRFLNWPYEEIHKLYGAADLFVLASFNEGFGLVSVEAMLSEVPVILHRNEINSWIAQGTGAKLIDMNAPGELARAMEELRAIGKDRKGREKVRERFSWEEIMGKYLRMYEDSIFRKLN